LKIAHRLDWPWLLCKNEILTTYLNIIPYGHAYRFDAEILGIGGAARYNFNKEDLDDLTLREVAFLVASIRAPTTHVTHFRRYLVAREDLETHELDLRDRDACLRVARERGLPEETERDVEYFFSPEYRDHYLATRRRVEFVLRKMRRAGIRRNGERIPDAEWDEALAGEVHFRIPSVENPHPTASQAVFAQLREMMRGTFLENRIVNMGLVVTTTIDLDLQEREQKRLDRTIREEGIPELDGAVLVTRLRDTSGRVVNEIEALVGSGSAYFEKTPSEDSYTSSFNWVTQARRPLGSSVKPMLVAAALESGEFTLATPILNAERTYLLEVGKNKVIEYTPANFDDRFSGQPLSILEALERSINVIHVELLCRLGVERGTAMMNAMMALSNDRAFPPLLSNALGGQCATLSELALGHSVIANLGVRKPFTLIESITFQGREVRPEYPETRILDPKVAYLSMWACGSVVERGTGRGALRPGVPVEENRRCGKTGTSQEYRDALMIVYNSEFLVGVRFGRRDFSPTGIAGDRLPAIVAGKVLSDACTNEASLPRPGEVAPEGIAWLGNRIYGRNVPFIERPGYAKPEPIPEAVAAQPHKLKPTILQVAQAVEPEESPDYSNPLQLANFYYRENQFGLAKDMFERVILRYQAVPEEIVRRYRLACASVEKKDEGERFLAGAFRERTMIRASE
jgi:membrane peptidoglycan carboxypeptidase